MSQATDQGLAVYILGPRQSPKMRGSGLSAHQKYILEKSLPGYGWQLAYVPL